MEGRGHQRRMSATSAASEQSNGGSNIKVVCRFRPLDSKEISSGSKTCVNIPDDGENTSTVQLKTLDDSTYNFAFDRVFDTESNQSEVFEYAGKPIVDDVLRGYNGCLLAYGQTGAGKTYTMTGPSLDDEEVRGVIPRVIDRIFDFTMQSDECMEFMVKVSFVEIYMERIRDLMDPKKVNLQVGEDAENGVYIKEANETYVASAAETYDVMRQGNENRATAATGMNAGSSRSHSLFILTLIQKNTEDGSTKTGKFFLVDLAGSETVNKTRVQGQQLEEAKKINQSLSALGNVIKALTDSRSKHTPYRDSKLTRVLQESLGGNARTALIINCSPSSYNEMETLSTLRFGKRAKSIKNRAVINKERSPAEMKRYIAILEKRVKDYEQREAKWVEALKTGSVPDELKNVVDTPLDNTPQLKEGLGEQSKEIQDEDDVDPKGDTDGILEQPKSDAVAEEEVNVAVANDSSEAESGRPADTQGTSGEASAESERDSSQQKKATSKREKKLQKQNDTYKQRIEYMQQVLQEAYDELKSLKEQNTNKDKQIEDLRSQLREVEECYKANENTNTDSNEQLKDPEPSFESDAPHSAAYTTRGMDDSVQLLRQNYRRAMDENNELRDRVNELDEEVIHLKEKLRDRQDESVLEDIADELQSAGYAMATNTEEEDKVRSAIMQDQLHESLEKARHSLLDLQEFERVKECCFEHERNIPQKGWSSELCKDDPPQWSDENEEIWKHKDEVSLPNKSWYWLDDWSVEKGVDVDDNGWSYGKSFEDLNSEEGGRELPRRMKGSDDTVRRRKWARTRVKIGLLSDSSKIGKKYSNSCSEEVREVLMESCKVIVGLAKRLQAQDRILEAVTTELRTRRETIQAYETRTSSLLQKMADAEAFGDVKRLGVTSGTDVKVIRGGKSSRNLHSLVSEDTSDAKPSSPSLEGFFEKVKKRFTLSPSKMRSTKETVEAFLFAAQAGDVERWKDMLKKGQVKLEDTDSQGRSAVLYAARGGQISSLEALQVEGANFAHVDSNGRNALHYATRQGCMDATVWLLAQGFSVHTTDGHALTPLHQAALGKHPLLCELLVGKGADIQATDVHGRTPLMVAERFSDDSDESKDIIQVLRSGKAVTGS